MSAIDVSLGTRRFDVVVLNFERLHLFFRNFHKLAGFDPERDRVTVVTCSPSEAERALVTAFKHEQGVPVRYLVRRNRGIDQLARAEYFLGRVGSPEDNLAYAYVLQMQDHYLDLADPASRWGAEFGHRLKGDTVPDGVIFDLPGMERLALEHDLAGMFCDRNNPCFIEMDGRRFAAPNGGNFIIATRELRDPSFVAACRRLVRSCDNSYAWAVHAEYAWGRLLFPEGKAFYDLKRHRLYTAWPPAELYATPDDYAGLARRYEHPLAPWLSMIREPLLPWARKLRRGFARGA